jgi:hypothetical protein
MPVDEVRHGTETRPDFRAMLCGRSLTDTSLRVCYLFCALMIHSGAQFALSPYRLFVQHGRLACHASAIV